MGDAKDLLTDSGKSAVRRYQDLVIGSRSLGFLIRFELTQLLAGPLPGACGLTLRRALYPGLLGRVGRGTVFGRNVTLRWPREIHVGENVVIDDGCVIDGRSSSGIGIQIGSRTMLARNVQIQAKGGQVVIGKNVGVGANCVFHAQDSNRLEIGDHAMIAPYVYIGGTRYRFDRTDIPIKMQGVDPQGGVQIGEGAWIGSSVSVMDGISIGAHTIIGAGAVVTRDIPDYAIAGGVPCRVIKSRLEGVET